MTRSAGLEEHLNQQMERSRHFFWNRLRWDLVAKYIPTDAPMTLVDVGAGPGFLGEYLKGNRPQVTYRFVEPIAALEQDLQHRFGVDANLRGQPSYDGASMATMLDVLEHIEDDRGFLQDLADKLAPGATLLVTVPALPALWSDWDTLLGHYRRYTKQSFVDACDGLPFQIEELSYLFPELIPLGFARKITRRTTAEEVSKAEFPDLPNWLNSFLYRIGSWSLPCRRRWPAGTSLLAVLRRD